MRLSAESSDGTLSEETLSKALDQTFEEPEETGSFDDMPMQGTGIELAHVKFSYGDGCRHESLIEQDSRLHPLT